MLNVWDGDVNRQVHFVTNEAEHRGFFRWVLDFEQADPASYECLAPSAFPKLGWANKLWSGLDNFSRSFDEIRPLLTKHLAVLDDYGAGLFRELLTTKPGEIGSRLSSLGAEASDEDGKTKQNAQAVKNRTRTFEGVDRVFFWHTKLHRHENRVHFLYDPGRDQILVGLFTRHCNP